MTVEQIHARARAWEEAAEHLDRVCWEEEDPIDKEQLAWVAAKIRRLSDAWFRGIYEFPEEETR